MLLLLWDPLYDIISDSLHMFPVNIFLEFFTDD